MKANRPLAEKAIKLLTGKPDWLAAWREIAQLTDGITPDDPRLQPMLAALNHCDLRFLRGDWPGFLEAADKVKEIVRSV